MPRSSEVSNPREGASVASVMFFWWMNDLMSLGRKRPLTDEDSPPLLEDYKAELLVKKAEKYWFDELKRTQSSNKKPQLWKTLSRLIPWESALKMIILRILWALSFSFLPVCLWLLLKTLNDGPNLDIKVAFFYVALLTISSMTKATSTQHYDYLTELWGLRLKVALIGLVYKKMLSLNRYSLEATRSGNTINLVSNDVQKIEKSLNQLGMVFSAPMELSISLGFLWYFIGWEALIGATVFFVLVAFQILLARKAADLRKKAATFTDERLMVMNEIIAGIRAVKMFAWEWNFIDVVRELRKKEMAVIRKKGLIVCFLIVLLFTTLPIAALISVTALVLTGTILSSFTIFTLLLGLVTIKFAFCNSLSLSVYIVADAKVALNRIQTFLEEKLPGLEIGERFHGETQPRTRLLDIDDNHSKVEEKMEKGLPMTNCNGREDFSIEISSEFEGSSMTKGPDNPKDDLRSGYPFLSISNVCCSWDHNCSNEALTLCDITLNVRAGELLAITGPVGSGKSSVLSAILGELPIRGGTITYHGKVAFVPQLPWVFSGSVRENILFGLPFDEEKFLNVVDVCGLSKELSDFARGDLTKVGQRGVSLSGGQKARVSLARAVYSNADIYLLDDPLSALDTKVGRTLFESCIVDNLSGCIRILVTHQLQYLRDVDCIVVMKNGSINHQGTYIDLKEKGLLSEILDLSDQFEERSKQILKISVDRGDINNGNQSGTLVSDSERCEMQLHEGDLISTSSVAKVKVGCGQSSQAQFSANMCKVQRLHGNQAFDLKEEEEGKRTGTVTWRLYWKYFKEGLSVPLIMHVAVALILSQVCLLAPNWWLARISEMSPTQQKGTDTQAIHASLVGISMVVMTASCVSFYFLLLKAAENLHNKMAMTIVKAPVLFYDTNPGGRILNRFSKDVGTIDDVLPIRFLESVTMCLFSLLSFLVPAVTNYWLFLALLPILSIFMYYARYYLASSRELKRIEAIKCSPVYSHFTETIHGLEIIHISNKNKAFLERLERYQDENTQAFFMVVSCNRWLGIRLDLLSSAFATTVAVAAILIAENPAFAGLALMYALETLDRTQYGVRMATEVENLMTSVERAMVYSELDSEPGYSTDIYPSESWPGEGSFAIENLSLAYFEGGPQILRDINVRISNKEKVGVVGRTGAGKSSLVSALFRMPDPLGKVLIDGVDIASVNLQQARRCMAVITQDPVLFGGSLRRNMDPFSKHTDQELWAALEAVQLRTLVEGLPKQLEFKIKESGTNLSVGERQLICLARALVQKSKIIVMDEATANVDFRTDRLIQQVIRHKFKDSTVLTIAHRLNTIMDYDKVLVLDDGQVVEFDKPEVLMRSGGMFAEMVKSQTHMKNRRT